ncbi:MAG TPA: riboflavin biosynthesis protein RibF [Candidatus Nanopelagicaceae bacterium]|nr:riboflavin biosynthesis protein RibF [Candidatus Nanopelagicaceae bacterium]
MESLGASPAVLAIGNFDGVHLGHQELLAAGTELARARGAELVAITFEPHPRQVLGPDLTVSLLTPLEMRRRLLARHGVRRLEVLPFNQHLLSLSPGDFLDRLRARRPVVGVVAGPRLSIGRGEEGRLAFVRAYAARTGIELVVVDEVFVGGLEISSTAIRERLAASDLEAVARMCGRAFRVLGEVEAGDGRGRQLGFPTANLRLLPAQLLPPDGVYVMRLEVRGRGPLPAVGSIGTRPQFGPGERKFEVHVLEQPGDLYGREVEVEVLHWLRTQAVFASPQELVAQMERDRAQARAQLA